MDQQTDIETYIADHSDALPAKFTIKVVDLRQAVGIVRDGADKGTIPILNNVLINVSGKSIKFTTTNMEIAISHMADGAVSHPGDFTVPVALLSEVTSRLPGDGIAEFQDGETTVSLKCGRFRYSLPRLAAAEFPVTAARVFPVSFRMKALLLADMLDRVGFMADTSEARWYLNGVYFQVTKENPEFRLVGLQSAGGGVAACEVPSGAEEMPAFIMPRRSFLAVRKIIGDASGEVLIEVVSANVRVTFGGTTLSTKLIDAEYPEYDRVFPEICSAPVAMNRDALKGAAAAAAGVSNIFEAAPIFFDITPDGATVRASGKEYAAAAVEMGPEFVGYKGDPFVVAFNSRLLGQIVGSMRGAVVWHPRSVDGVITTALMLDDGDPFVRYVLGSYKV